MTTTFYSARYLDFLNGTFRGEPHPITNDFWDYSASFPDVPLDRQYNRSLTHGVEGLGDITVFLQNTTNQNELLTAIAATAVALKQAGVLVGDLADLPNHTGRHYIIDIGAEPLGMTIGGTTRPLLSEETAQVSVNGSDGITQTQNIPRDWESATITLNSSLFYYEGEDGTLDTLLHEVLHALGHGHDGRYNGNTGDRTVVGEVDNRVAVCNTNYEEAPPAANILAANLEILWNQLGRIDNIQGNDFGNLPITISTPEKPNSTYVFTDEHIRYNIVDSEGTDTMYVGDAREVYELPGPPPFGPVFTSGHFVDLQVGGVSYLNYARGYGVPSGWTSAMSS